MALPVNSHSGSPYSGSELKLNWISFDCESTQYHAEPHPAWLNPITLCNVEPKSDSPKYLKVPSEKNTSISAASLGGQYACIPAYSPEETVSEAKVTSYPPLPSLPPSPDDEVVITMFPPTRFVTLSSIIVQTLIRCFSGTCQPRPSSS